MSDLVVTIPLSKGRFHAIVDRDIFPLVLGGRWSASVKSSGMPYGVKMVGGKMIYLHRHVLEVVGIDIPVGMDVDHINRDSLDNRLANLRIITHEQNMNNLSRRGVGVRKYRNRWNARIFIHNREVCLGTFDTKEEALAARAQAEADKVREVWG